MKNKDKRSGFTPQENLVSILPSITVGIIILFATIVSALINFPSQNLLHKTVLIICGVFGVLHLVFYYFIYAVALNKSFLVWINVIIIGFTLCALTYFLPKEVSSLLYILVFILALPASLLSNRGPAHLLIFSVTTFHFILNLNNSMPSYGWITHIGFTVTAFIGIETVYQLKNVAAQHIKRLEIINDFSKQIVSTLDTKQFFVLLNTAFQSALEADSYYLGIVHDDQIRLELFYDDGEYIPNI